MNASWRSDASCSETEKAWTESLSGRSVASATWNCNVTELPARLDSYSDKRRLLNLWLTFCLRRTPFVFWSPWPTRPLEKKNLGAGKLTISATLKSLLAVSRSSPLSLTSLNNPRLSLRPGTPPKHSTPRPRRKESRTKTLSGPTLLRISPKSV